MTTALSKRSDARSGTVRIVGALVGFSAAIVSVHWPEALGSAPSPSTMLIVVALAIAFIHAGRESARLVLGPFDFAMITLIFIRAVVEIFNASDLGHSVATGAMTTLVLLYLSTFPARLVIRSRQDFRTFCFYLALPAILVAIVAVLQLIRFPGVMEWILQNVSVGGLQNRVDAGRDDLRATSTIGHWTSLGGYLCVATALFCLEILMSRGEKGLGRRGIAVVGIVVLFVGQVSTLTFGTIAVCAAVILVTILRLKVNPLYLVVAAGGGLIAWQIFGSSIEQRLEDQAVVSRYTDESLRWLPSTVAYRVRIWQTETIPAIEQRPLTGWGQQTYTFPDNWSVFPSMLVWNSPESQWLGLIVRGGLVDLAAFLGLLVAMFIVLRRARRVIGTATTPLTVVLVGLLVTCLINSPFSTNGVPQIWWPILGALLALASPRLGEKSAIASPTSERIQTL
ncbi:MULTISPECIES: O-antigen ligase family protein [unclassified Microbacterium]|uniref:O-antigen ligase family protein n=1 Tax=unclassified Microbacterium TaxID=2609290 RepID=UPI001781C343|nr:MULTISPECIES: O-antigen ligase family protein [unclassified Microbacterium]MBD8207671.1 O-antigen ligase family protein [Microbacterium sp. CFBP 8801]MBD8478159.1 O-antigen ligase family protein [Microbacterium sp. CFBP 8794]MBD8508580.1 O-antigen ligase family protein [Microbacterium sp. CFBP 8790]